MGKGGGCMPTKNKFPINEPAERPVSQTDITGTGSEAEGSKKLRIFIVFYSMYGHVETLARRLKKGVDDIEGVEGVMYMVPEILAPDVLERMKAPPKNDEIPVISVDELMEADGFLFGFPTRYGCMAAQMKAFFDSTGKMWREQKLAGLPAGFFVSTGTQGGGQETTAWTAVTQLAHHGMLYVPIGYTFGAGMFRMDSIIGGSPYGAGTFSGDGSREPSEPELALAEHQGKYMAMTVKRLSQHHSLRPDSCSTLQT
ncbi:hypothetical protein AABB24_002438 [Solanum stoloniferum]|uniref:NAD(P)H dehydrogenase (quinone) n=1 Tax=Solanum stoloniferum TaxID=62892 RepID=A0ABD2VPQ4_9SOLN